ncbi:MAG TPA: DNA internalization-related competence protein ComEC/Rec2 [Candidatus Acidoferrum sp.]|nr:DNA internalization-related competence protein ComEC/Rec2 [Candidatus Acidoferrum sp.]
MRSWTIAFAAGALLAALLPVLPRPEIALALVLVAILLPWWPRLCLTAAALLGASWLCLYAGHALDQRWPEPPFPRDVWVEATVIGLPVISTDGSRLQLQLDKVCLVAQMMDCDFKRLPYDGRRIQLSLYEPLALQPGQRWRLLLRLKPPHGLVNPGGFDHEAWMLQQRLSATAYLRHSADNRLLADDPADERLQRWRYRLARTLTTPAAAVLQRPDLIKALTIGEGGDIPDADWQLFAATGTTHLLVISGSHVALVMVLLYGSVRWLASRFTWLLLRMPASMPAALAAIVGSWVYTGLAGFSLPALRAWWMVMVLLLARLWRRQIETWHSLGLALVAVLLFDPLAMLNAGCWLSFTAVAVLLRHSDVEPLPWWLPRHWPLLVWRLLRLQLQLTVALLPVVLVYFQQTSVIAPLANLLLIPLLAIVVPLALAGVMASLWWQAGGLWLLQAADFLLTLAMQVLRLCLERMPQALQALPALGNTGLVLVIVSCTIAVFAAARWQRALALVVMGCSLYWLQRPSLPYGALQLQVLDVGQGLAVVVHTARHHLLYDAGPAFSAGFDAGSDVVLPTLRATNVRELDGVVISHADRDHAGGLPAIARQFPQAWYSSSLPALFAAGSRHGYCRAGQQWQWDGVGFAMLHPGDEPYHGNDSSCVLLISAGTRRVLLAGDIEKPAEQMLLRLYPDLRADVLVTPHHGSNTSSTPEFIRQLQPLATIHSTGYLNRFHHPATAVRQRYRELGVAQYDTAEQGAVTATIGEDGRLELAAQRDLEPRFWRPRSHR